MPNVPKRLVTGTNADLRKLPLKEAKEICRDYGVREEEVCLLELSCLIALVCLVLRRIVLLRYKCSLFGLSALISVSLSSTE